MLFRVRKELEIDILNMHTITHTVRRLRIRAGMSTHTTSNKLNLGISMPNIDGEGEEQEEGGGGGGMENGRRGGWRGWGAFFIKYIISNLEIKLTNYSFGFQI